VGAREGPEGWRDLGGGEKGERMNSELSQSMMGREHSGALPGPDPSQLHALSRQLGDEVAIYIRAARYTEFG
jgi:hypothetical protein